MLFFLSHWALLENCKYNEDKKLGNFKIKKMEKFS